MTLAWQEIKPKSAADATSGDIYLSVAVSSDGLAWKSHERFFGPLPYTGVAAGNQPSVYSMVMDAKDRIIVAVSASDRETLILQSTDAGASFQQVQRIQAKASTVAPALFVTKDSGFLLLISQGSAEVAAASPQPTGETAVGSASLMFSHSRDGRTWTDLAPFVTRDDHLSATQLQPAHAAFKGRDYVVFESLTARNEATTTWQLFVKASADGGASWSAAAPLTTQQALFGADALSFNNERPRIEPLGTQLGLVWERAGFGSNRPQIWSLALDADAAALGVPDIVAPASPSRFARILTLQGQERVLYADSSKGTSRIVLAQKAGRIWSTQTLPNTDVVDAIFPHALVFHDQLYIFWENQAQSQKTSSLVQLRPLTSVGAPVVKAVDFIAGQPTNRDTITVSWTEPQPPDPAGIREYRTAWTYSDGSTTVEKEHQTVSGPTSAGTPLFSTRKVDRDGTWIFSIAAVDFAGNVTRTPATISFLRDASPPRPVSFEARAADGTVLLTAASASPDKRDQNSYEIGSNSFALRWVPGADSDIDGYTYNLQPGWNSLEEYRQSKVELVSPPARKVTQLTEIPFNNRDNGVYVLTVQAIDKAGNFGPASTIAVALSHYQVVTRIDLVTAQKDALLGTVKLTINGRGFTENGPIRMIYLDRNHAKPPFDMEFDPVAPITVADRQIAGILLDQNRDSGSYRVGLQQDRPNGQNVLYFTPGAVIDFTSPGTVKIGNFQVFIPRWLLGPSPAFVLSFDSLLVVLVVAMLCALMFLAIRKIAALAQEGAAVRAEVMVLLEGRPNARWEERKKRMQALKRRGIGLRLKFTLLMVILVFMIVLIVSIPLGLQMVGTQRRSLAADVQSKANILLGALATSAETQFRAQDQGFLGAADIPALSATMPQAEYTTITGPDVNFRPADPKDFVWASNQKKFIDEKVGGVFNIAREQVNDDLAKTVVPELQKKIDTDLTTRLSSLIDEYRNLVGQRSALQGKTDPGSKQKLAALTAQLSTASKEIDTQARAAYGKSDTLEPWNGNARLRSTYLFYIPVIFYNRAANLPDTTFYQGMVRLQVNTSTINKQIDDAISAILRLAGEIALLAIAIGVLGAIIMASITVTPIRRLARGVAVIRDTDDKEELKDHSIEVGTRDEIGLLADTVNEMTRGLVKAAVANKELLQGIDVQKRFLPLVKSSQGGEASTTEEENEKLEIYGYYKGAKGVSGDYFDFKKLDNTYYALIKCDVSGKGVSAALIMVEVATLFISHFRDWAQRKENIAQIKDPLARQRALKELERLDLLVYTINDMVEERGFVGRFAALTVCLYNAVTGVATVCNAGDTRMHLYSVEKGKMVYPKLPDSPAAGMFASMLVDMKTPFRQVQQRLVSGDVLFLPTDGFSESERKLRNADFQEVKCEEPGIADGEDHLGTHDRGDAEEELGEARMEGVINAVLNKGHYTLVRTHNPVPNEELVFDFSGCKGTAREAVLALVSVEKVYRMIPDPRLGEESTVTLESKVAQFLKEHFLQYARYFSHQVEGANATGYATFTHAKEDEQYDDLTIIVLRKK
jgi:serine phosphatase RsbU (regulator of sigma subunit)/HAMP domain-containing protein